MRRIAFLTDLHADVHALQDALRVIASIGIEEVVALGDYVDYGLFPDETIALLVANKVTCIEGNHDDWQRDKTGLNDASVDFLCSLRRTWSTTYEDIRIVAWHASPRSVMNGIYPNTSVEDLDRHLRNAEADVLLVGHTHIPMCLAASRGRLVCNPGALLRAPADAYMEPVLLWNKRTQTFEEGEPGLRAPGTFGILDLPSKKFTVHRAKDGEEVPT